MATKKVSFRIPEENLKKIDQLIKQKHIKDRSAFFNNASDELLKFYRIYLEEKE